MKIAVLSDTHDNIWNVRKALEGIRRQGAETIIHCGDIIAPFVFKEFQEAAIPLHAVFGNNDGDTYLLTRAAANSSGRITLYGMIGEIDAQEMSIAFTHGPRVGEGLAATGKYDLVCCGHTHVPAQEKIGNTTLINPGDVMGKEGNAGFCILDTGDRSVTRLALD